MLKCILISGAFVMLCSSAFAKGEKCAAAQEYLDANREKIAAHPTESDKIEILEKAIAKQHDFLCDRIMKDFMARMK